MYPPALCGLMHPSSTGVLLGVWLLVIQPSSGLPSKSRSRPSAFSLGVSSLLAARRPAADRSRDTRTGSKRITERLLGAEVTRLGERSQRPLSGPIGAAHGARPWERSKWP